MTTPSPLSPVDGIGIADVDNSLDGSSTAGRDAEEAGGSGGTVAGIVVTLLLLAAAVAAFAFYKM